MAQQLKHISVPRPFDSGDITEWLNRFKICAKANGWDAAVKAVKLPTLLEGKALAVWLDFTKEEQGDYSVTVDKLKRKLAPTVFSSLEAFHTRKLHPDEALSLFLQDLKQMLHHLMLVFLAAREQLLLHQFLASLPVSISKQLWAAGDVTRVEQPSNESGNNLGTSTPINGIKSGAGRETVYGRHDSRATSTSVKT